ncbi:aminomethyl-transferring glycine dehydrogenase [Marinicellulosiphila megalodicopiae]|uniref:aminomethyl-transferring glycine dehydrogenase n=1 Tax=Marinicellulosiphila megalodicopiae TaxID=2724896 RepID=UPI003BB04755
MNKHNLFFNDDFLSRHVGSDSDARQIMLERLGVSSLEAMIDQIIPSDIRISAPLNMHPAQSEFAAMDVLRDIAKQNKLAKNYIGQGYYECITPPVIGRNLFENPGWYTAYTPYQPEIAQGRLECLLNYQQMVVDLTGMEMANASLLDEATAAAEAMSMIKRANRKNKSNVFFIDEQCFAQTIDVVKTRAPGFGFEVVVGNWEQAKDGDYFGALLQYPGKEGQVQDPTDLIEALHQNNCMVAVATDLLALMALKSPGQCGADVVLGNSQRFGVPMGFGGPHAAFFATKDAFKRNLPGRIIGVSKDTDGNFALRMALQTREQHIRREKANSNICTAQVLLANMAVSFAIYHGPARLKTIAQRVNALANLFAHCLRDSGLKIQHEQFFDTVTVNVGDRIDAIKQQASEKLINLNYLSGSKISVSFNETNTVEDILDLAELFVGPHSINGESLIESFEAFATLDNSVLRQDDILTHPVFNTHHSETQMMRYLKSLENKDLALNHSMISLGSCTMKLNAASQMQPVSWPEFSNMHPFAPKDQTKGYLALVDSLTDYLKAITGFDAICMQPNSGAQGEYAGLLAIQKYHEANGQPQRNVCIIPQSAHGTNPASAQMAGLKVVVSKCDDLGNVDFADLKAKVLEVGDNLSCLMATYPSTHGVYEKGIKEIFALIHEHGGQVYMDGANLNAQVGLVQPAQLGADVSHMNLHKTFAIPHGGGGPGMGPIGVKAHLAPFVANHSVTPIDDASVGNGAVSAAAFGSASILPISWMYIASLGQNGLPFATANALLNANYLAQELKEDYPILYSNTEGWVAHECIIDLRPIKAQTGVTEVDIAKRLMDFGFHAPTMSFPVAGTFMIEPTESESKGELDRFILAMRTIKQEIQDIHLGKIELTDSPLSFAPHTQQQVLNDNWDHKYTREQAAFGAPYLKENKFWPTVSRIDDVYGDRNLFCTCPAIEDYES